MLILSVLEGTANNDHLTMGDKLFIETPQEIKSLEIPELSDRVAFMQQRIEQGVASDDDYLEFIICQLELAERGMLEGS